MDPESLAEFLQATVACVAAGRLLRLGLAKRQPALLTFVLATALELFALASFPTASAAYFWIYLVSLVLNWLVSVYVVREMFTLALVDYPGIRTVALWAVYAATGTSITASLAFTFLWNGNPHGREGLFYAEFGQPVRFVQFGGHCRLNSCFAVPLPPAFTPEHLRVLVVLQRRIPLGSCRDAG